MSTTKLLTDAVTSSTTGEFVPVAGGLKTFQATVVGTGTQTATVVIEVSNDGVAANAMTLGTITLSGTTTATDGFASWASWAFVRAKTTVLSGTGATVNVTMS